MGIVGVIICARQPLRVVVRSYSNHLERRSGIPGPRLFLARLDMRNLVQLIEQLNLDELERVVRIRRLGASLRDLGSFGGAIRIDEDCLLNAAAQESHFIMHVLCLCLI